ncbi:MAG: type II toxin-antitoxin system RelE/ParE family toxin [Acidobacteria bacterium]|nr:type II toxin-antitoxin system RelE/ParE family toxin [Acidobacteriota bacterium]MBI3656553.1 type II toxin-antitoxin system RelE/ParE family toxin [Acidobacteriota bacterium]
MLSKIEAAVEVLKHDPHNLERTHLIKKLEGVRPGEGQWRIRFSNYRILYDILEKDVVLYFVADRKEAYKK